MMPAPLSLDLRGRIVSAYRQGLGSYAEIADMFSVGVASVSRLLRRDREEGTVAPLPHGGGQRALIGPDETENLRKFVASSAATTAEQLAKEWTEVHGVELSRSAMVRALKRAKITFKKKTLRASEKELPRVIRRTEAYYEALEPHEVQQLVFLDESGCNTAMTQLYGWAPQGQRATGHRPGGRHENVSVIGAIRMEGPVAMKTVAGSVNGQIFVDFLRTSLVPRLAAGDVVIMDNLKAHYNKLVRPIIEAAGAEVVYLPPYSPELNPIEFVWPVMKRLIREISPRTVKAVRAAIRRTWRQASQLCFESLFAGSGYA